MAVVQKEQLAQRFAEIRQRVYAACKHANRDPDEICLVAVSKRHSADLVRDAYALGQRDFGENYVQELVDKAEQLKDLTDLRWHFIGHLQRNKAKKIIELGAQLQTLDSFSLLQELNRRCSSSAQKLQVWVQVNLAEEPQKSGCKPQELPRLISKVKESQWLKLQGLMLIPPAEIPENNALWFERLRKLGESLGVTRFSMGMSADFEIAIAAGSTCVRIGTDLFGTRA